MHHFTTRALHALYFTHFARNTRINNVFLLCRRDTVHRSFFCVLDEGKENERETHRRFHGNRGRGKKSATKEMPDRGFWSALAPDGEKSADDYNKWKAELMEKKRKAQEEAAKKPKKFLGLF